MITQLYDFKGHKIGDCIAAAYCLQVLRLQAEAAGQHPPAYALLNRGAIDIAQWFPDLAHLCAAPIPEGGALNPELSDLPGVPLGNLWISAPTIKLETGVMPVMHVPVDDQAYDVALHCLTDAGYNTGRNHTPAQFDELERWLHWHKLRVYRVPPMGERVEFSCPDCDGSGDCGGYFGAAVCRACDGTGVKVASPHIVTDHILKEIGRAKAYIGGDTGFTHAFAAMHPQRPLLALYGDDWHNVIGFEAERARMQCASPWCSDPLSFRLYKRVLRDHRFEEREIKDLLEQVLQLKKD